METFTRAQGVKTAYALLVNMGLFHKERISSHLGANTFQSEQPTFQMEVSEHKS